jgi:hypothetical protein
LIARCIDTSANSAPSVPRSRSVVKPAISVRSQCTTASTVLYASGSVSTWSFHSRSL